MYGYECHLYSLLVFGRSCLSSKRCCKPGFPRAHTCPKARQLSRDGKNSALVRSAIVLQSAGSFCSVNPRCRTSCSPSFLLKCECVRESACVHECPGSLGQGYFPCCNNDPRVMHLVSLSGSHLHLVIVPESKHFPPSLHPPPLFPKHLPSHLTHKYGRPTSRTL